MRDLTSGSISAHLVKNAGFMLATMVFQTLYFLIDLYWVGRLGTEAVAAVAIAGNLTFFVLAITQVLAVGTTAVVAHAVGSREHDRANFLFNQSQSLSMLAGVVFLLVGMAFNRWYTRAMSADAETARLASEYLDWFIPAMALQFAIVAMGAALRATGNFRPTMVVGITTIVINMVLAPFLIFGWVTGYPLGVAGAAISSLIAVAIGVAWFARYFLPADAYLRFHVSQWKPHIATWKRMLGIGLPTGFEFAMMAVYLLIVYALLRPFGAAAQAAFGIGMRITQAGFMPVVALGMSVAPVAGQNYGARLARRVKHTFRDAALMAAGTMLALAIVCWLFAGRLVGAFTNDGQVVAIGARYLTIIAFNFVASGLIFVASSMFQAMGNTVPSLVSSAVRIVLVAVPAVLLARVEGFHLEWIWYLSVASVLVQMVVSLLLLRREFRHRLDVMPAPGAGAAAAA
jgi:putative MATE family efflux protein